MQTKNPKNKIKFVATELPPPAPGEVISIPISLWPQYLYLHSLEAVGSRGNVVIVHLLANKNTEKE